MKAAQGAEGIKRRGLVLAYLMRFKQLCNHRKLLGDSRFHPRKAEIRPAGGDRRRNRASRQERALVFTQFREMTEPLAAYLASVFGRPGLVLHGQTAVKRRQSLVDQFQRRRPAVHGRR